MTIAHQLNFVLASLPVAVTLISRTGRVLGARGGLTSMLGDMIPSRDGQQAERWSFTGADGALLPPSEWPTARALRGECDCVGMIGTFREDGDRTVRVISVPLADPDAGAAAMTFLQLIKTDAHGRRRTDQTLARRLIDELVLAVAARSRVVPVVDDKPLHRIG